MPSQVVTLTSLRYPTTPHTHPAMPLVTPSLALMEMPSVDLPSLALNEMHRQAQTKEARWRMLLKPLTSQERIPAVPKPLHSPWL